jgi:hypothetical protein
MFVAHVKCWEGCQKVHNVKCKNDKECLYMEDLGLNLD